MKTFGLATAPLAVAAGVVAGATEDRESSEGPVGVVAPQAATIRSATRKSATRTTGHLTPSRDIPLPSRRWGCTIVHLAHHREGIRVRGSAIEHEALPLAALIAWPLLLPQERFHQVSVDPFWGPGARNYFTSSFLNGLPDEAIEVLARFHLECPSPLSEIHIHHMGGAVGRLGEGSAFGNR
jgi:hypothetical protein